MHTFLQRANALLTFAGTVLAVMCTLASITDYFHIAHPKVSLDYLGSEGLSLERNHDRAFLSFNLKADLRSEFTWNTKQLFVYANVEFTSPKYPKNQMMIWNAIIQRSDNALISLPTLRTAFPFAVTDMDAHLRGTEFNVTVAWHVMPRVGRLYVRSQTFSGFQFPDEYLPVQKGNIRSGRTGNAAAAA